MRGYPPSLDKRSATVEVDSSLGEDVGRSHLQSWAEDMGARPGFSIEEVLKVVGGMLVAVWALWAYMVLVFSFGQVDPDGITIADFDGTYPFRFLYWTELYLWAMAGMAAAFTGMVGVCCCNCCCLCRTFDGTISHGDLEWSETSQENDFDPVGEGPTVTTYHYRISVKGNETGAADKQTVEKTGPYSIRGEGHTYNILGRAVRLLYLPRSDEAEIAIDLEGVRVFRSFVFTVLINLPLACFFYLMKPWALCHPVSGGVTLWFAWIVALFVCLPLQICLFGLPYFLARDFQWCRSVVYLGLPEDKGSSDDDAAEDVQLVARRSSCSS